MVAVVTPQLLLFGVDRTVLSTATGVQGGFYAALLAKHVLLGRSMKKILRSFGLAMAVVLIPASAYAVNLSSNDGNERRR